LYRRRVESLKLNNNYYGSTGLLRISDAGSGAAGTFRFAVLADWFNTTGFLCTEDRPCRGESDDSLTHFGTSISLSVTPLSFLEVFASMRSYGNADDMGKPRLLQTIGDSIVGLKVFLPDAPNRWLRFGVEGQLLMLAGSGDLGLLGEATGFRARALSTLDFAALDDGFPLRIYANVGYHFDNSGKLIDSTEKWRRGDPINRIERYSLGINRTDTFEVGLGAELPLEYVRPFVSYNIDLPFNRQDYVCNKSNASTRDFNDACLGENSSLAYTPSRITVGARGYPWLKGLAPMVALDIGVTGTKDFVEELSPQAPWTLYFGVGYAVDVVAPPEKVEVEVERTVQLPPPPQYLVRGTIVEKGTTTPVENAIVVIPGSTSGGFSTGQEGVFESRNLPIGEHTFSITAEGYHPGQCVARVTGFEQEQYPSPSYETEPAHQQPPQSEPPPQPSDSQSGYVDSSGYYSPPAADTAAPASPEFGQISQSDPYASDPHPVAQQPATRGDVPGAVYTYVTCELEALPRVGNIVGQVVDASSNAPVPYAAIVVIDAQGNEHKATSDGTGHYRIDGIAPGSVKVRTEADKYLLSNEATTIEPSADRPLTINLNAGPRLANVVVTQTQITIKRQINFETDKAVITEDSNALMQEIADTMMRNPRIKLVEVQRHTDNTGTAEHNQDLSQRRADAVKAWLVANGVDASRLETKGYGQTRPLAPNVTVANRAKNRRVQFVIKERE